MRGDISTQSRFKEEALAALSAWTRSRFNRTPTRKTSEVITKKLRETSSEPDDLDLILPWLHYDWSRKSKLKDALEHFGKSSTLIPPQITSRRFAGQLASVSTTGLSVIIKLSDDETRMLNREYRRFRRMLPAFLQKYVRVIPVDEMHITLALKIMDPQEIDGYAEVILDHIHHLAESHNPIQLRLRSDGLYVTEEGGYRLASELFGESPIQLQQMNYLSLGALEALDASITETQFKEGNIYHVSGAEIEIPKDELEVHTLKAALQTQFDRDRARNLPIRVTSIRVEKFRGIHHRELLGEFPLGSNTPVTSQVPSWSHIRNMAGFVAGYIAKSRAARRVKRAEAVLRQSMSLENPEIASLPKEIKTDDRRVFHVGYYDNTKIFPQYPKDAGFRQLVLYENASVIASLDFNIRDGTIRFIPHTDLPLQASLKEYEHELRATLVVMGMRICQSAGREQFYVTGAPEEMIHLLLSLGMTHTQKQPYNNFKLALTPETIAKLPKLGLIRRAPAAPPAKQKPIIANMLHPGEPVEAWTEHSLLRHESELGRGFGRPRLTNDPDSEANAGGRSNFDAPDPAAAESGSSVEAAIRELWLMIERASNGPTLDLISELDRAHNVLERRPGKTQEQINRLSDLGDRIREVENQMFINEFRGKVALARDARNLSQTQIEDLMRARANLAGRVYLTPDQRKTLLRVGGQLQKLAGAQASSAHSTDPAAQVSKLFSESPFKSGMHLIDLGCGVTSINWGLHLARLGLIYTGLEKRFEHIASFNEKIAKLEEKQNVVKDRVKIIDHNYLKRLPADVPKADFVTLNSPYADFERLDEISHHVPQVMHDALREGGWAFLCIEALDSVQHQDAFATIVAGLKQQFGETNVNWQDGAPSWYSAELLQAGKGPVIFFAAHKLTENVQTKSPAALASTSASLPDQQAGMAPEQEKQAPGATASKPEEDLSSLEVIVDRTKEATRLPVSSIEKPSNPPAPEWRTSPEGRAGASKPPIQSDILSPEMEGVEAWHPEYRHGDFVTGLLQRIQNSIKRDDSKVGKQNTSPPRTPRKVTGNKAAKQATARVQKKSRGVSLMDVESILTYSEFQALGHIGFELSNKEIADQMKIGVRSVEKLNREIRHKLGIPHDASIYDWLRARGWTTAKAAAQKNSPVYHDPGSEFTGLKPETSNSKPEIIIQSLAAGGPPALSKAQLEKAREIRGKTYLPISEAAKVLGDDYQDVQDWVTNPDIRAQVERVIKAGLDVMRDPLGGALYISVHTVELLADRFEQFRPTEPASRESISRVAPRTSERKAGLRTSKELNLAKQIQTLLHAFEPTLKELNLREKEVLVQFYRLHGGKLKSRFDIGNTLTPPKAQKTVLSYLTKGLKKLAEKIPELQDILRDRASHGLHFVSPERPIVTHATPKPSPTADGENEDWIRSPIEATVFQLWESMVSDRKEDMSDLENILRQNSQVIYMRKLDQQDFEKQQNISDSPNETKAEAWENSPIGQIAEELRRTYDSHSLPRTFLPRGYSIIPALAVENAIQHVLSQGQKGFVIAFRDAGGTWVYLVDSGSGMPLRNVIEGDFRAQTKADGLGIQNMISEASDAKDTSGLRFVLMSRQEEFNSWSETFTKVKTPLTGTLFGLYLPQPAAAPPHTGGMTFGMEGSIVEFVIKVLHMTIGRLWHRPEKRRREVSLDEHIQNIAEQRIIESALRKIKDKYEKPETLAQTHPLVFAKFLGFNEIDDPDYPFYQGAKPLIYVSPDDLKMAQEHPAVSADKVGTIPRSRVPFLLVPLTGLKGTGLYYHQGMIEQSPDYYSQRSFFVEYLEPELKKPGLERALKYQGDYWSMGYYSHPALLDGELEFAKWMGESELRAFIEEKNAQLHNTDIGSPAYDRAGKPPMEDLRYFREKLTHLISEARRARQALRYLPVPQPISKGSGTIGAGENAPQTAPASQGARENRQTDLGDEIADAVGAAMQNSSPLALVPTAKQMNGLGMYLGRAMALTLLPIAILVALIFTVPIKLSSSGPVLFKQERIGYQGRPLTIWKLRTMTSEEIVENRSVTWLGKIFRPSGIDELPQLWSIVKGDMQWFGPRPVQRPFVDQSYIDTIWSRTKPGFFSAFALKHNDTVKKDFRNERFPDDLQDLAEWSFWRNLTIFFKTFNTVSVGALSGLKSVVQSQKTPPAAAPEDDGSTNLFAVAPLFAILLAFLNPLVASALLKTSAGFIVILIGGYLSRKYNPYDSVTERPYEIQMELSPYKPNTPQEVRRKFFTLAMLTFTFVPIFSAAQDLTQAGFTETGALISTFGTLLGMMAIDFVRTCAWWSKDKWRTGPISILAAALIGFWTYHLVDWSYLQLLLNKLVVHGAALHYAVFIALIFVPIQNKPFRTKPFLHAA